MGDDLPEGCIERLVWAHDNGIPALLVPSFFLALWTHKRVIEWLRIPDYDKIARLERELFGESE